MPRQLSGLLPEQFIAVIHDDIDIDNVPVEEILGLRTRVLRPHFAEGELARWPGDDDQGTSHFAATRHGEVVGCVTFQVARFPHDEDSRNVPVDVQLRGMAVEPDERGHGIGAQLLEVALFRLPLIYPEARRIWCNARQGAVAFYERAGFETSGDYFDKPDIGPHIVMWRPMPTLLA